MAGTEGEKPSYNFSRGYITEQSPVAVAEGSALDMENFEIDTTGGIRRRRAIAREAAGEDVTLSGGDRAGDEVFTRYVWRNAAGEAGRTLQVFQLGQYITFLEDQEVLGVDPPVFAFDLSAFKTPSATATMLRTTNVSFADGRSHLFISSENTEPFYIAVSGSEITAIPLNLRIRDFTGIVDGVANTVKPIVLTTAHRYNLFNRGWTTEEIDNWFGDKGTYPAKNMLSIQGYRRQTAAGTQEGFGTKVWDSDKLEAEIFKDVSAPQGSLLLNPFDTSVAYGNVDPTSGVSSNIPIDTWSVTTGSPNVVTITTIDPHGLTDQDQVTIDNNRYKYVGIFGSGIPFPIERSLDGTYTAEVVDADTFRINVPAELFANFTGIWSNQYLSKGTVGIVIAEGGGNIIASSGGYITDKRPAVVAWYAGRVWYFGTPHERLIDTVMFSQIAEGPHQYGLCYQASDPTSEILNALTPADGGTIRIAGLHGVKGALVLGASLVVAAESGIWEIRGGGQLGFTADNYIVRKITDAECTSMVGMVRTESALCVATKRGLFALGYDRNSGLISADNISAARVNTYWNTITDDKLATIRMDYDDAKKRLYTLISKTTSHTTSKGYTVPSNRYTEALVLDFRLGEGGAFYKLSMPLQLSGDDAGYIGGITVLDSSDNSGNNRKVKYVYVRTAPGVQDMVAFCDTQHNFYTDISGEEDIPFFAATYDNTNNWHTRKRAANFVYMFMGRTETGYIEVGDEIAPVNPGSVFLQGRWEWADNPSSGKWTNPQQVYRPRGVYVPATLPETTNKNGQPVVVTRNKIRGSGRALSLYIYGETEKDAHILGWLVQYGTT